MTCVVLSRRNIPPTFPLEMPRLYAGVPLMVDTRIRAATLAPVSKLTSLYAYFSLQRLDVLLSNIFQTVAPLSVSMVLVMLPPFSKELVSNTTQLLAVGRELPR